MPVRSLGSSVLKWPNKQLVDSAVRSWAEKVSEERKDVQKRGYFGSYARGDWGVGSDLDIVVILDGCSDQPMERGAVDWDTTTLPVPSDLLIYTIDEWERIKDPGSLGRTLLRETYGFMNDLAKAIRSTCSSVRSNLSQRPRCSTYMIYTSAHTPCGWRSSEVYRFVFL
jgi:predicted nucleotidyltransferase